MQVAKFIDALFFFSEFTVFFLPTHTYSLFQKKQLPFTLFYFIIKQLEKKYAIKVIVVIFRNVINSFQIYIMAHFINISPKNWNFTGHMMVYVSVSFFLFDSDENSLAIVVKFFIFDTSSILEYVIMFQVISGIE